MPFFFQFTRSGALMSDQKNAEANKIVYLTQVNSDGLEQIPTNGPRRTDSNSNEISLF